MTVKSATFGRRPAPQAQPLRLPRAIAAQPAPVRPQARPGFFARLPWLTLVLCGVLTLRFQNELRAATDFSAPGTPGNVSLLALGASSRTLVLDHGEWWRIFTATMLHGSWAHLIGNLTALLVAGVILEPLIGIGWFGAIYFTGGLGGEIFSMALNPASMPGVGASGAIMACVSALFAFSFHDDVPFPHLMRWAGGFLLFPALISTVSHGVMMDVSAHLGGVMAGMVMTLILLALWPEDKPQVPGRDGAALIAGGFIVLTVASFALSAKSHDAYAAQAADFIPQAQMPDALTHFADGQTSARLLQYPEDPRAHLFRAVYDLNAQDLDAAQFQMQQAAQLAMVHPGLLPDSALQGMRGYLAVAMTQRRGAAEGRRVAAPLCGDPALDQKLRLTLDMAALCPPAK